jgi:pSer/pThr/pTyr-binding forkhead associated (FHA) protein
MPLPVMIGMSATRTDPAGTPPRRPARDLIDAVVDNMRQNLEPLKYSTLAPSRYTVYLHPNEFARLEGIIPILRQQTVQALSEELEKLNGRSSLRGLIRRWRDTPSEPHFRNAGGEWQIEFLADPDGEMAEGDLLIDSELILPANPDLGVGERTRRITTTHGQRTQTREHTINPTAPAVAKTIARLEYDDDAGQHSYEMSKDLITIGRGGIAYPVDVRIVSSPDVSREHARLRRDPQTGRFFLIDVSTLGTTLNGRHVPKGYDEIDGAKRENGAETALPDTATIGLADTVVLEFRIIR